MRRLFLNCVLLLTLVLVSCNSIQPEPFQQEYVVESCLVAGQPLPTVYLSTTLPADTSYSFSRAAVSGAVIEVHLLGDQGAVEEIYEYTEASKGRYQTDSASKVLSGRTYELSVVLPNDDNHELWAQTQVPGAIQLMDRIADTVVYQEDPPLEVRATVSPNPGRPNFLLNSYLADHPYYKNLTPYYAEEAVDDTMSVYYDYNSLTLGLINVSNYTRNPDHSVNLTFPWQGFAYYGSYQIVVQVVDDNMLDRIRSATTQLSGSTLSPGQIENVIEHVDGGIGVFGSIAADTLKTFVARP